MNRFGLIVLLFFGGIFCESKKDFVATNEWQVVKEGQAVPEGLHVRLNLQTGLKEAKLLDKNDNDKSTLPSAVVAPIDDPTEKPITTPEKSPEWKAKLMEEGIRDALKNIKSDDVTGEKLTEEELKQKFRPYKELKKDYEALNKQVKTDQQVIDGLVTEWLNHTGVTLERKKIILQDLEFYLHQVDNAVNFAKAGFLESVILPLLNQSVTVTTADHLHSDALLVLGAATQSNSHVQIRALQAGVLPLLLRLIAEVHRVPVVSHSSARERDNLLAKLIYCLSALCRQFPLAQSRLVELGGLASLRQLHHTPTNSQPHSMKVHIKTATFIHDMLNEHRLAVKHSSQDDEASNKRSEQYKKISLLHHLSDQGWCSAIISMFEEVYQPGSVNLDHDNCERTLLIMRSLGPVCSEEFAPKKDSLHLLLHQYKKLNAENSDDEFFQRMEKLVNGVIKDIVASRKDEL